jgi:flagellar biosynthetic protein FliQ
MTSDLALQLLADLFWTGLLVCLPLLGITMAVGLAVSVLQVITQIQEMSLSFVPKLFTAVLVTVIFGPWMLRKITSFTTRLWTGIPNLV